jgi:aconitate hydratase
LRFLYFYFQQGSTEWQQLECPKGPIYPWEPESTYIKRVPFFDGLKINGEDGNEANNATGIHDAFALLNLGDSVTTDHISPAGSISRTSPAAKWLIERGFFFFVVAIIPRGLKKSL